MTNIKNEINKMDFAKSKVALDDYMQGISYIEINDLALELKTLELKENEKKVSFNSDKINKYEYSEKISITTNKKLVK